MKHTLLFLLLMCTLPCMHGCAYRKGDAYQYEQGGDTLRFIVRKAGSGEKILDRIRKLTYIHVSREDDFRFIYLTDSAAIPDSKAVLLFNSEMPDFENDLLSKGYLGAFGTKEIVTYMVVAEDDFDRYFSPAGPIEQVDTLN